MIFLGRSFATPVALLVLVTPAWAADPIIPMPPPVPIVEPATIEWVGPYMGTQGGFGWAQFEQTSGAFSLFEGSDTLALDGFFLGVHAGYNAQMDNIVLGIEGDINVAWMGTDFASGANRIPGSARIDWFGSMRGRLGFAVNQTMLYGTAGIAFAGADIDIGNLLADTQTHTGWTAGLGVEHLLDEDWSIRGEYRYYDFGTATYFADLIPTDVDLTMHTIKIGLSYHF